MKLQLALEIIIIPLVLRYGQILIRKPSDNNNLNEFCLFTLNKDGEPVILFEGIDTFEIDTAIENIVQSF